MQIVDSVALVTGANRGLGRAFVSALLAAGARKVYAASRTAADFELPGVVPLQLDVTDPAQIEAAAQRARDVTLLVNNAGISRYSSLLASDAIEAARAELETNTFGPLRLSRAFAPVLRANGGGAIVNVLSALSWFSLEQAATYSMSKAAGWSMTNGLRNELRAQATQVVAVHVGWMDTDMAARAPGPKTAPADVVEQTLRALEAGEPEVFADEITRALKSGLSAARGSYLGEQSRS